MREGRNRCGEHFVVVVLFDIAMYNKVYQDDKLKYRMQNW
jgi:hypothetical protein